MLGRPVSRLLLIAMTSVLGAGFAAVAPAQTTPAQTTPTQTTPTQTTPTQTTEPREPRSFSMGVDNLLDDRQPWVYKVDGILEGQKEPTLCTGKVVVLVRLTRPTGRVVARRSLTVRTGTIPNLIGPSGSPYCFYQTRFSLRRRPGGPRGGTFVFSARFMGNAEIAAKSVTPLLRACFGRGAAARACRPGAVPAR